MTGSPAAMLTLFVLVVIMAVAIATFFRRKITALTALLGIPIALFLNTALGGLYALLLVVVGVLVTLVWSAKESMLKALRTGLRLDTRWVAVDQPAAAGPGRWRPLTVRHPATGRAAHGWWRHDAGRVLTMVATPPPAVPRRIQPDRPGG